MAEILRRQERVAALLRNLISSFIKSEDLSGAIITITDIEVSEDIRTAKIFISVFPEEKEKEAVKLLEEKSRQLYNYLSPKLKMKFMPVIHFLPDKKIKAERRIDELLNMAS